MRLMLRIGLLAAATVALAGPGALELNPHALAPVAELPVLQVVSTVHLVADLTLGLGKVVHDYLAPVRRASLNVRMKAA